ncbi:Protein FAR1-RELATED SEQUENCE 11, partial [Bienertia sinuspersici]
IQVMLDFDFNEPLIEENDREIDEPFIGQTFTNHEEAFAFYNNYAKQHGFVVRKDRSDTRHRKTIRRDLVCHRGGIPKLKVFDPSKTQRNKESARCDLMELQKNVKHGELPFLEKDIQNFVGIMKKSPKTIITDQVPWMSKAIAVEMPSTKHSFCIWHITSKFSSWFVSLLRDNYQAWCQDFYLLYKMTNPNEFEENWPLIVEKYDLQDNKHIQGLYKIRFLWAPAYLREHFLVDIGIEDINQQHIHLNLTASLKPTYLKTKSPLEEQVFGMFTPYAFKMFQQELTRATLYSLIHMEGDEFMVRYYKGEDKRSHKCSCKNIEFWVFSVVTYYECYFMKIVSRFHPPIYLYDGVLMRCKLLLLLLLKKIVGEVLHPPQSKTKGRPKNKREKVGKEVARKQTKSGSICSQLGHTKPTCLHKENICSRNDTNDGVSQKKQKKSSESLGLNPVFTLKV